MGSKSLMSMAKVRSLLRKLALSALALLLFLVAAELVARLAEPGPMSLYDTNPYLPDPDLGHVHEPGFRGRWDSSWYGINSRGWRGPEVGPTFAKDEFRVVCLGDSCTFGKGVVEGDTWPRRLEELLREKMAPGRRPVVFNLGVNGYSMWQYLRTMELQAQSLRPHLVLLGYNVNDYDSAANRADRVVFAGVPDGDMVERNKGKPTAGSAPPHAPAPRGPSLRARLRALLPDGLRARLNRLALYRYMRATFYDWTRERDYAKMQAIVHALSSRGAAFQAETVDKEAGMLGQLVTNANACGARVALFLFPFEAMVYIDEFDRGPEQFVQALADRLQVGFVDVPQAFRLELAERGRGTELFIRGDRYHPNAAGYELVARTALQRLEALGWLEVGY